MLRFTRNLLAHLVEISTRIVLLNKIKNLLGRAFVHEKLYPDLNVWV